MKAEPQATATLMLQPSLLVMPADGGRGGHRSTKATDRLRYDRCTGPWRRAPGNSTQVLRPILTRLCRATFRDPHADRHAQQRLRGQSHQLWISSQQHDRFSAPKSQIKAVVNRVIQMTRESQCLHLKVTVRFDVIHECSGPAEALLQAFGLQLISSLQPPEFSAHSSSN